MSTSSHNAEKTAAGGEQTLAEDWLGSAKLGGLAGEQAEGLQTGQLVGRYVVVERLGSGSMGVVYRAYDPDLDRRIALKLVRLRASNPQRAEEVRTRLLREAQAIARLSHPNVVQVYDVGAIGAGLFVAMEFVDGITVKRWMRSEERTWSATLEIFVAAGRGLAAAHRAELVHRDFKPDNVMVSTTGEVKVLDFGLARAVRGFSIEHEPVGGQHRSGEHAQPQLDSGALETSLTSDGAIVGTPAYMAPEQHVGSTAGAAADQFSYCVALWEALYGERPFDGETQAALAVALVRGKLRPAPAGKSAPRWVHQALVRGLATEPGARFATMEDLLAELTRDPRRDRRRLGFAASLFAVGGAAAWLGSHASEEPDGDEVCDGAIAKMDAVWNPSRRKALEGVYEGSGLTYATAAWTRTAETIEAFVARWIEVRTDACRATRVHGEQSEQLMDRRMTCLDRRLADLDALLGLFEAGTGHAIESSIDAARELGTLRECSDAKSLSTMTPAPSSPTAQVELEALEAELVRVRALERAGGHQGAPQVLDAIAGRVEALAHPPLTEQFFFLRGRVQSQTGDTRRARSSYERAFREALVGGELSRCAWIAARLVYVVGHRLADESGGRFWAEMAHDLLRVVEDDGAILASLRSAEASLELRSGNFAEAERLDGLVRDYWVAKDPTDPELATILGNLAVAQREQGRHGEAIETARASLDIARTSYGPDHPDTASAEMRLGLGLSFANRDEEALAMFEHALATERAAHGALTTDVAVMLDGIGRTLRGLGRLEESEIRHREAYEIWLREYGPEHPDVAVSLMNIGYTLFAAKKYPEALEVFERAYAIHKRTAAPDHPTLVYCVNAIAGVLLELDRFEAAHELLDPVLRSPAVDGAEPTLVGETQFLLARALWNSGGDNKAARARALELAEAAASAYTEQADLWAVQLAEVEMWLEVNRK